MTSFNEEYEEEYEEIHVTLKLKKNIAQVGKLIAKYHYKGSFDVFASEEVRQAILAIGPDYPKQVREYANKLVENEEMRIKKMMMSIRKRSNNNSPPPIIISKTLRQEIKELIDIIGHREDQLYRDGCLEDICKVLEKHLDIKINNWIQSFTHHEQKEKEWLDKGGDDDLVFKDIHNSMKIYSNGAAHGLQFFKDELLMK